MNKFFKSAGRFLAALRGKHYLLLTLLPASGFVFGQQTVAIEEKPLTLPTYQVAPPDKNPIFYTGRNYQGAQGHIYPQPLYDVLTDERKDQTYKAVYLNNEYLELCILPEIGGRIFSALDKTNQFDFFYHQHVIKPALIGMTGAWISGGVEWNIPDHHRATSYLPVDYTTVENADGSKTAWVGETELSRGLKWMVGLTVYPGKSYIEATVKVFNPTSFAHSFLYWANVSVHCDENYQVIFPPSTQYGVQHAKSEFTSWPVGSGRYGGVDRTGVDLSWWKNFPNPASIFAWNFTDDFLAGYDYAKDAGTVHVANHHIVTGKKFFLWGNNAESKTWEKMLTDNDGQYLELMVGAYSDNQPDYSWIAPGETRVFKQYWYPVKKIGGVKNANTNAAVNFGRKSPGMVNVGLITTSTYKNTRITLTTGNKVLLEEKRDMDPANPYLKEIQIDPSLKDTELTIALFDSEGTELISYSPKIYEKEEAPEPVEVPKSPKEYKTIEELYLTGLRIEQFRNAVIDPMPYYQEALARDSFDYRVNTILGIHYCKEGKYAEAEEHLRRAIKRVTKNYTRPKDGEAFYYLGEVLQLGNRLDEAADQLWKATWYNGFQAMAYFKLAQLECIKQNYAEALALIDRSLVVNSLNTAALTLKAYALRKTNQFESAASTLKLVKVLDKLDSWSCAEDYFLDAAKKNQSSGSADFRVQFQSHIGNSLQNILELAKNYGNIGAYNEAITVLEQFKRTAGPESSSPLVSYYMGFYNSKKGANDLASGNFAEASRALPDFCFPWRLEEIEILQTALKANPADSRAWYYLGNIHYYLNQKANAIYDWEQSVKFDPGFALAWRNLGFAYDKVSDDLKKSASAYKHAIGLNNQDPRLFAEYDVIQERMGVSPADRLSYLQKYIPVLEKRDDAITRLISLYNLTGNYTKALDILNKRHFHVWEGNGSIHDEFEDANLLLGLQLMESRKYAAALACFQKAATYPDNLEVGKPEYNPDNIRISYYIARAYEGLKDNKLSNEYLQKVAAYNDGWNRSELRFYKAMSLKRLNKQDEAKTIFEDIRKLAEEQLNSKEETDFFAKFGETRGKNGRLAYNYYLIGLSYIGEDNPTKANEYFRKSLDLDQSHPWVKTMQQLKISL